MKPVFRTLANKYLLLAVHMTIFSAVSTAVAQCPGGSTLNTAGTYTNGTTVCITTAFSGAITLNNGATMVIINGGKYTGDLTAKKGSTIQVQTGGTLSPSTANTFEGTITNNGTVSVSNASTNNALTITNTGGWTSSGSWNLNAAVAITNSACGNMQFTSGMTFSNASTITNNGGILNFTSSLSITNATLKNSGYLSVAGDFTFNQGQVYNQYKALFKGANNTFNATSDSLINLGWMTFTSGFTNNTPMRNEGLLVVNGSITLNSSAKFLVNNSNAQFRIGGALSNNSTIAGSGSLYVAGAVANNSIIQGVSAAAKLTVNKSSLGGTTTNVNFNTGLVAADTATYVAAMASTSSCTTLAQQLSPLQAVYQTGQVQLNWYVYSPASVQNFTIEYSQDGQHFSTAGQIAGNSNNTSSTLYQYIHYTNLTGVIYYRIRETDFDGSVYYSTIVVVKAGSSIATEIFPNPFTNTLQVNLQLTKAGAIDVQLFDAGGRILKRIQKQGQSGFNAIVINDLQSLLPGIYFARITAGDKTVFEKLIK